MTPAILIIDGDLATRRVLRGALGTEGYRVWEAGTAKDGLAALAARAPQAVLLDFNPSDSDGLEVVASIRDASDVPVLVMAANGGATDQVDALDSGANDYILKPFREAELLARLRAALRIAGRTRSVREALTVGALRLESADGGVFLRGREVPLTPKEFKLLEVLAREAGRVVTHRRLLASVWGTEYIADIQYLRVFIQRLRGKLERDPEAPELLITAPRIGYRLRATD